VRSPFVKGSSRAQHRRRGARLPVTARLYSSGRSKVVPRGTLKGSTEHGAQGSPPVSRAMVYRPRGGVAQPRQRQVKVAFVPSLSPLRAACCVLRAARSARASSGLLRGIFQREAAGRMSERSRSHGRVRYPEAVWRVVRLILGRLTLAIAAAFVALFLFAYVAHDSFPSGHAFFALTIYGMLAYLLSRDAPPRRRRQRWGATVVVSCSSASAGSSWECTTLPTSSPGFWWHCPGYGAAWRSHKASVGSVCGGSGNERGVTIALRSMRARRRRPKLGRRVSSDGKRGRARRARPHPAKGSGSCVIAEAHRCSGARSSDSSAARRTCASSRWSPAGRRGEYS